MKRIEAIIQEDKLGLVVDELRASGVIGITTMQAQGIGAGERPMLGGSRGTAKFMAPFNKLASVIIITDDQKVDSIVKTIMDTAHTGNAGDGKIFVTNVEDAFDIATKQGGKHII